MDDLERRVVQAAEAVLAQRRVVSAVEVLVGMRWLTPAALARWQQGRVEDLESVVQVNLHKLFGGDGGLAAVGPRPGFAAQRNGLPRPHP